MRLIPSFSESKFISGFVFAAIFFGSTAFAVGVNNSSEGGYLLCVNNKTRVVTYPGVLKCPTGFTPIEISGKNGFVGVNTDKKDSSSQGTKQSPVGSSSDFANCNLQFILDNPSIAENTIEKCSASQLEKLIQDINSYDQLMEEKLKALKKDPEKNTNEIAKLVAESKARITLLSLIVKAIQKKINR